MRDDVREMLRVDMREGLQVDMRELVRGGTRVAMRADTRVQMRVVQLEVAHVVLHGATGKHVVLPVPSRASSPATGSVSCLSVLV